MCIIVAGTIIFAAKYLKGSGSQVNVTEASTDGTLYLDSVQSEINALGTTESTTESVTESASQSSSGSSSESTSGSTAETPSGTPAVTAEPSPATSEEQETSSEETTGEEVFFALSSEPDQLTSISDLSAGTLLSEGQIDKNNLSQYFTSVRDRRRRQRL